MQQFDPNTPGLIEGNITTVVVIDPAGTTAPTPVLFDRVARYLDTVRLIGEDLEIRQAEYVPLDIRMRVCALDPFVRAPVMADAGVTPCADLPELLQAVDILSLHAPLVPETRRLIGAGQLELLRPGAILINTARGPLVFDPRPGVVVRRRAGSASRDLRAMAECSLRVLGRAFEAHPNGSGLTSAERRVRIGRLWHDLAYARLVEGDAAGTRAAVRQSVSRLPLFGRNYIYWISSFFPEAARRAIFARRRAR